MLFLVKKIQKSLVTDGLLKTVKKAIRRPYEILRRKKFEKSVFSLSSAEERFTWIYENNYWNCNESLSGIGSSLEYTESLRKALPSLIQQLSIKSIFDAPCGDFNWMRHLLKTIDVEYIGGDVVRTLIDGHNKKYKNTKTSFVHCDLVKDPIPKTDMMICRDCLFHLSYDDTMSILINFVNSETEYILTTTHKNVENFSNRDIITGDFRLMDLFSAPYYFSPDPIAIIDDWMAPEPERQMCLWTRNQVVSSLKKFRQVNIDMERHCFDSL